MDTVVRQLAAAAAIGVALAGCAGGKDAQAAYVAAREASNIQGSAGDSGVRVNIPYELDGKKGLYQCIAEKQVDGTFKVAF